MAKTIPQLTDATTVNAADELIIQQSGVTKRATAGEFIKSMNAINNVANVKDFGAVGDGVADDASAIQAAINDALSKDASAVYFPSGNYKLNSRLSFTLLNEQRLKLFGDGMYVSTIVGNNTVGAIWFDSTIRTFELEVCNLGFEPALDGSGEGLKVTAPAGGEQANRIVSVHDCSFGTLVRFSAGSWNKDLTINGVYRPIINNVLCDPGVNATTKKDYICSLDGCYKPEIRSSYFRGDALVGVSHVSDVAEGFYMEATTIVGPDTGLVKQSSGTEPEMSVTNCHFNCINVGVDITGQKFVWLTDNLMYAAGGDVGPYYDFVLRRGSGILVSGNIFRQPGKSQRRHVAVITSGSDTVRHLRITGNKLHASTTVAPFYFDNNAREVTLELPLYVANFDFASYPSELYEFLPSATLTVFKPNELVGTSEGPALGPAFVLSRNSASPAASDSIGALYFNGRNSDGDAVVYNVFQSEIVSPTSGAHSARLKVFAAINGTLTNAVQIDEQLWFRGTVMADTLRHLSLRSYTVATLPSASNAQTMIYVSNGTSNKRLAVSDGTNWRFPDGNIVS